MKKSGYDVKCGQCSIFFYIKRCEVGIKKFCSKKCYDNSRRGKHFVNSGQFKKGQESWSKGTKGILKANSGSFKKGKNHPFFKGIIHHQGYVLIYTPNHPNCDRNGYVKRGRLVMEKKLRRYLTKQEVIHHKNHVRNDDRHYNLMLFGTESSHQTFHEREKKRK